MQINKDRAKQVVQAMREEALAALESGRESQYSFTSFCKKNKLLGKDSVFRINETIISCPFHSDAIPSCHLNEGMWAYNCFACKGGNFVNFRFRYETEILGRSVNYYQLIEEMLREDKLLAARLGFGTIYEKKTADLEQAVTFKRQSFKARKSLPATYIELVDKVKKLNPSTVQKKMLITMMQSGIPVKDAYKEFFDSDGQGATPDKEQSAGSRKRYSIAALDAFGEDSE